MPILLLNEKFQGEGIGSVHLIRLNDKQAFDDFSEAVFLESKIEVADIAIPWRHLPKWRQWWLINVF